MTSTSDEIEYVAQLTLGGGGVLSAQEAAEAEALEMVSAPSVIISEYEVRIATSAALAPVLLVDDERVADQVVAPTRWWSIVAWSPRRIRVGRPRDRRPRYPRRADFTDDARMAREMLRL